MARNPNVTYTPYRLLVALRFVPHPQNIVIWLRPDRVRFHRARLAVRIGACRPLMRSYVEELERLGFVSNVTEPKRGYFDMDIVHELRVFGTENPEDLELQGFEDDESPDD